MVRSIKGIKRKRTSEKWKWGRKQNGGGKGEVKKDDKKRKRCGEREEEEEESGGGHLESVRVKEMIEGIMASEVF